MSPILNNDMKTYIRHITLTVSALLAALVLAASCARDERDLLPADMIPLADLELSWQVEDPAVYTKAGQSVHVENRVENLYILLFDGNGDCLYSRRYYVGGDGTVPDGYDGVISSYNEKQEDGGAASSGTIPGFFDKFSDYESLQDASVSFYAVANYSTAQSTALDAVRTVADLQDMTVSFTTEGNVSRSRFLMEAQHPDVRLNGVEENGQLMIERVGVNLVLRRIDAKITFRLTFDIDDAVEGSLVFSDMAYRVHNVPDVAYLFERSRPAGVQVEQENTWDAAAADPDGNYSCMLDDNFETFDEQYTDRTGGEFSFYLRESRPVPKKLITASEQENWSSLYAMREAWTGGSEDTKTPVHGRNFTYAPEKGTLVEISGELSYTRKGDNGNEEVYGNVTYIIHLGETGNNANDPDAVNNYDVRRNVRYIYNVTVRGVNDLLVEVETGEERPGVEGDITVSEHRQYRLDAHYGRLLLELNRNNLENAAWVVTTPLGSINYTPETGITAPYDYKWVLFAINRQFRGTSSAMVKFPGTQAYNGGLDFFSDSGTPSLDDMHNDMGYADKDDWLRQSPGNYYRSMAIDDEACLRDINQLINYLRREAESEDSDLFESDGTVAITAFVDEYAYVYDPRSEDYIHPGEPVTHPSRLILWKEYVNVPDRSMDIVPMSNTHVSEDGNTSVTNSYITISQNSIKTIYDASNSSLETAWGLETTNETGMLTHSMKYDPIGGTPGSYNDGRSNFLKFWTYASGAGRFEWDRVMTTEVEIESADGLSEDFRDAFHACITRNRDLDGDNMIEANEIYWYLAARDQLTGLWIGQPSLDESAWMYNGKGEMKHFVTSSNNGSYIVLWAEEGATFGPLRASGDDNYYYEEQEIYDYRCIRNLGVSISDADQSVSHYADQTGYTTFESNDRTAPDYARGYYTVDVGAMNGRALRSASDDGRSLPMDNEQSQNNRPYRQFDVLDADRQTRYGGSNWAPVYYGWENMIDAYNRNINPCPDGWRVPNQREMLILVSTVPELSWNNGDEYYIPTFTTFSFNGTPGYDSDRYGFLYGGTNVFLNNGGEGNFHFRCVRDHVK